MSRVGVLPGGQWGFRPSRADDARERWAALGVVALAHAAVAGGFVLAALNRPAPPPERVIEVSFVAASRPGQAASPPQAAPPPPPPPPEPTLMATPRPTSSPMTAPPVVEREPVLQRPMAPVPAPAFAPPVPAPAFAPPAPAPVAAAPAASSGAAADAPPALTPPNFTAAYLNNPGPAYPMASRRKREQGTVRLRVHVSAEGDTTQVLVDRSSGHPDLDAAALDVVKKRWRFEPAKQGGRTVAAWVLVPMEFSLKDR